MWNCTTLKKIYFCEIRFKKTASSGSNFILITNILLYILDDQQLTTETPVPEENLSNNLESVRHYSFRFLDEEIPIENIQEPEQIAQHLGKYILTNIIISTMGLSINDCTHFII